jgi:hypothetical protein
MQNNLSLEEIRSIKYPIFQTENIHKTKHAGRTVIKVEDCFTTCLATKANTEIDNLDTIHNTKRKDGRIKRVVIDPTDKSIYNIFTLKFNDNNETEDWSHLAEKCNKSDSALYSLAKNNINYMAKTVGWQNEDIQMSIIILRYYLNNGRLRIKNLPWHQDPSTTTMTTLLTPPATEDSQDIGFTGGNLNFSTISKEYKQKYGSPTYYADGTEYNSNTIQTFAYPENGGFIFDNITSFHKVSDIELHNPANLASINIERRLFSIFAYPKPENVVALADKTANNNIVNTQL